MQETQNLSPVESEQLSPQELRLKRFALYFLLLQLILLPITVFVGDFIIGGIDLFAHTFLGMNKVEAETNKFWQVLAVSLTASLALCSFKIWSNPHRNIDWVLPILVATSSASACFLAYYLYYGALSLLLGLIFQFGMFVPMLILWWRTRVTQSSLAGK